MNKRAYFSLMIVFLAGILLLSAVSAEKDKAVIPSAFSDIKCKNNLSAGVLDSILLRVPAASSTNGLLQYINKLKIDILQLQTYFNNEDKAGFRDYVKNTYNTDLKDAKQAVNEWRKTNKNVTGEQKTNMKEDYDRLKAAYTNCHLISLKEYEINRVIEFNNILSAYQNKISELSKKGVDVTSLNKLMVDARSQIIQAYQLKIESGMDVKDIKKTFNYCLLDGCKDGTNFHLAAKFEIAKLDLALQQIENNSEAVDAVDKIIELKGYINAARTALNSVGTAYYTKEQKETIWTNIKSAQSAIRDIKKIFRGDK